LTHEDILATDWELFKWHLEEELVRYFERLMYPEVFLIKKD
jgi:hypothetical protein